MLQGLHGPAQAAFSLECPYVPFATCCNLLPLLYAPWHPVFPLSYHSPCFTVIPLVVCLLSSATSSLWAGTMTCLCRRWPPSTQLVDRHVTHAQLLYVEWMAERMIFFPNRVQIPSSPWNLKFFPNYYPFFLYPTIVDLKKFGLFWVLLFFWGIRKGRSNWGGKWNQSFKRRRCW